MWTREVQKEVELSSFITNLTGRDAIQPSQKLRQNRARRLRGLLPHRNGGRRGGGSGRYTGGEKASKLALVRCGFLRWRGAGGRWLRIPCLRKVKTDHFLWP